jgi:hypothetical protein
MMLTDRDVEILLAVCRYYVLTRHQIGRLFFPDDKSGRATRRRLQMLVGQHLLARQSMLYCHPSAGAPASVYYPAPKGTAFLAEHLDDERFHSVTTQAPLPAHIPHWVACSDTHIAFDHAKSETTKVVEWVNEWDVVNKAETEPEKRYRLYTLVSDKPRVIAAPDCAFLLKKGDQTAMYYLEQDRATSGIRRIAASKTPGYAELAKRNLHRKHFQPTVEGFRVLMVAPHPKRRDGLRKEFVGKPGCELWRFAAAEDVTPEKVMHEPVWYSCEGQPVPLVK